MQTMLEQHGVEMQARARLGVFYNDREEYIDNSGDIKSTELLAKDMIGKKHRRVKTPVQKDFEQSGLQYALKTPKYADFEKVGDLKVIFLAQVGVN